MRRTGQSMMPLVVVVVVLLAAGLAAGPAGGDPDASDGAPIRVRPVTVAHNSGQLAGRVVEIWGARVVGMRGSRVLVIDTDTRWPSPPGHRDRILVLIADGEIHVRPDVLVGSSVRVTGVARTPVGLQVTGEVPWPAELDREGLRRLDIRAAVLATSVQTADGVELTDRPIARD